MVKLAIPKEVVIANPRLKLVFNVLLFIFIGFVVARFWFGENTVSFQQATKTLIAPRSQSLRAMIESELSNSAWCHDDSAWENPNARCVRSCFLNQASHDCKAIYETVLQIAPQDLFVAAAFYSTPLHEHGQQVTPSVPHNQSTMLVVPSIQSLSLQFYYEFSQDGMPLWPFTTYAAKGNSTGATTVILDADGKLWGTFRPGKTITLDFEDLATVTSEIPEGARGDAEKLFVKSANEGAIISVSTDCYNTLDDVEAQLSGRLTGIKEDTHGTVCVMKLKWGGSSARVISSTASLNEDRDRVSFSRGIRFQTENGRGFKRFPDLNVLYQSFVSAVVMFSIPTLIMRAFMLHCMGELSSVYKRGAQEQFSIRGECGAVATRLMTYGHNFTELADQEIDEKLSISQDVMHHRLKALLEGYGDHLDDKEIERLVGFCYNSALDSVAASGLESNRSLLDRILCKKHEQITSRDSMDSDAFGIACASNERIAVPTLVRLFDKDRRRNPFERLFTPSALRKAIFAPPHERRRGAVFHIAEAEKAHLEEKDTSAQERTNLEGVGEGIVENELSHSQAIDDLIFKVVYASEARLLQTVRDMVSSAQVEMTKRLESVVATIKARPGEHIVTEAPSTALQNSDAAHGRLQRVESAVEAAAEGRLELMHRVEAAVETAAAAAANARASADGVEQAVQDLYSHVDARVKQQFQERAGPQLPQCGLSSPTVPLLWPAGRRFGPISHYSLMQQPFWSDEPVFLAEDTQGEDTQQSARSFVSAPYKEATDQVSNLPIESKYKEATDNGPRLPTEHPFANSFPMHHAVTLPEPPPRQGTEIPFVPQGQGWQNGSTKNTDDIRSCHTIFSRLCL